MLANRRFGKLTRRRLLAGVAALASGLPTALAGSRARAATPVKLTLPWIANGSNYWPVIGKKLGYFSKRGIDVDVARGFGSVAAAQALIVGVVISAVVGVTGFLAAPQLLRIMGASDSIVRTGSGYTRTIFGGSATIFFLFLMGALIRGGVGYLLIRHPNAGAEGVTMVLAVLFIVGGLLRTIGASVIKFP